ncbi:MAG: GAF domain-containing protein [Treponema sp.]|jgi:GAF domain-containing protein|nr:GAF domain-containing protein [Treponema sp.]
MVNYPNEAGDDSSGAAALLSGAVKSMLEDETDLIAGLANVSAVVKMYLPEVNWAGFYLLKGKELVLGPFQGLPACARIGWGQGVCGRAVLDQKRVLVSDVRAFPGHIVCDSASASEIVVPLFKGGEVFGVLDIDSPRLDRFPESDADYIEHSCDHINRFLERLGCC